MSSITVKCEYIDSIRAIDRSFSFPAIAIEAEMSLTQREELFEELLGSFTDAQAADVLKRFAGDLIAEIAGEQS